MNEIERLEWEKKRGQETLERLVRYLRDQKKPELSDLSAELYAKAEPYLVEARHGNPLHHTAQVLEFAVRIGIQENLPDEELRCLIAAAIYHDSGFARIPKDQKKIKKAEIDSIEDPAEKETRRKEALQLRREHADKGSEIVAGVLKSLKSFRFSGEESNRITNIIRVHDNPTIAELVDHPEEKKKWLFSPENRLEWMHREADRLWMLSIDGLIADLETERRGGRLTSARAKIEYNTRRHFDERALYQSVYPDAITRFNFREDTAFYRTVTGQKLFLKLRSEAIVTFDNMGADLENLLKSILPS